MNKYKLIKEYPGSPKLGTIVRPDNYHDIDFVKGKYIYDIPKYPEFWEEVVEKDYEIITYRRKDGLGPISKYQEIYGSLSDWQINSVKRLSDGEVFTVGDNIQYYNITGQKAHIHTIDNITIYQNKVLLNHNHGTWKSHGDFNKVQKVKQPLFTTEDGVDIYEGDSFYTIDSNFEIQYLNNADEDEVDNAWFSKEAAEEYILMNKPCLSINDIRNRYNYKWSEIGVRTLKELVKSKL